MNLFLIGMMGCGKSYWSQQLGQWLHHDIYDLDDTMEKYFSDTIASFFSVHGENTFRKFESQILKSFSEKQEFVMAAGGGTPCFYDNMDWMKANGKVIWINESAENIAKRLIHELEKRPVMKGATEENIISFVKERIQQRTSYYKQAHIILEPGQINIETFKQILTPSHD